MTEIQIDQFESITGKAYESYDMTPRRISIRKLKDYFIRRDSMIFYFMGRRFRPVRDYVVSTEDGS